MHTEMPLGQKLFATMKALGLIFKTPAPQPSAPRIEPLPADQMVRPSMHNRVTIQNHHEDWP